MLMELRAVLVEDVHASLAMKDLTVATVKMDISNQRMELAKV